MKVHYVDKEETTLCGKKPKPKGLIDPYLEYWKDGFFKWGKEVRCKICESKINCI